MLRQTTISAGAHDAIKWFGTLVVCMTLTLLPQQSLAQENEPVLTLEESIHLALERNMEVQVAKEEIRYAAQGKNRARTGFLPKLKAEYVYRRLSESTTTVGGISSEFADQDQFRFTGTATQPLFTGFETLSTFQLAKLGLDVAKIQLQRTRLDLILSVKETYFEILRAEKISQVAEQSVRQLQEGVRVAQNFVQVGMRPKVDVLDAETRLGEAELQLIVANNDIGVAKARFNTVL
ncbi:MAG: TolC family protein, partial [Syntrophobacterales bacterium]